MKQNKNIRGKKMKKILLPVLILMLCLTGCGDAVKSDKVQIYTSFYAMEQFAKEIAGDRADVMSLIPSGGEVHGYEPTVNDVKDILKADLFIYNGNGMEHWSEDFVETVSDGTAKIIEVSAGMPKVLENSDPHSWLSLDNALYAMNMIKKELISIDPINAEYYEENYAKAQKKSDTVSKGIKNTDGKTIVVTHGAYGYLCDDLNLTQLSIEGVMGESDPTPSDIIRVAKAMREQRIKYIFTEKYGSDKLARSIADEVGAEVLTLDAIEKGDGEMGYFEAMEENIKNIKLALE